MRANPSVPRDDHRPAAKERATRRPIISVDQTAAPADLGPLIQLLVRLLERGERSADHGNGPHPAARAGVKRIEKV